MQQRKFGERVRLVAVNGHAPKPGTDIGGSVEIPVGTTGSIQLYNLDFAQEPDSLLKVTFPRYGSVIVRCKCLESCEPADGIPDLP